MLAEIMEAERDVADVLFLIAFIVFVLAALVAYPRPESKSAVFFSPLVAVGLALVAFALMAL